jgi:hypothetical protein
MSPLAAIIDTKALLNVVWVSFAVGVGGTTAFSIALVAATRFAETRREGRAIEAAIFGVLGAAALAACLGAIALGFVAVISK